MVVWLSVSFGHLVLQLRGSLIMVVCVEGARGVGDVVMEGWLSWYSRRGVIDKSFD